ncbi:polysaccharide pyruvyl transferase family protein [Streptomyces sp. NBC_01803]|uniref:polysaccharide pyruvyl transferase family protein n=1 Tax=Streptomyces sp. NBC_01803 TaxID=2975946 RepID=UPI002DDA05FF|nr:polysaccharide pyruvyl transferase family protein [Streptomyces sp. NBC_01803]WSA43439.1 polysaccharide pyruvyl transferase family protein [Streptomyces sp. NBC_01803]
MTSEVGRTLVTGWFSFLDGEATAGDVLALSRVRQVLDARGVPYDVAWSPRFEPGGLALGDARPGEYTRLVFVCGPLHGPLIAGLHGRFAHCRRVAVGVSVIDPADPAVTGFHEVLARDGADRVPEQDLAMRAPRGPGVPVVGVLLTRGQREYGERRAHDSVAGTVRSWLAGARCAPVALESRLDREDGLLCGTAEEFLSVVERLDAVVTDRLHGLVLPLRVGVPPLVIDPVRGGAKVSAQARACRWPALVSAERVAPARLDAWLAWCLDRGAGAARRRRPLVVAADPADRLPEALGVPGPPVPGTLEDGVVRTAVGG